MSFIRFQFDIGVSQKELLDSFQKRHGFEWRNSFAVKWKPKARYKNNLSKTWKFEQALEQNWIT